jgi:hypothetical protein
MWLRILRRKPYIWYQGEPTAFTEDFKDIRTPIILGRCPSLSAQESESMLRTYLVCREKRERERERETSKRHVGEAHSVLITAILLPQRLSCYWGEIVSLRMLTNLRLADLRVTTAQQRSTGQNLPSDDRFVILTNIVKVCCAMDSACILDHSEEQFRFEIPTISVRTLPPRSWIL